MSINSPKAGDRFTVTYRGCVHRYLVINVDAVSIYYEYNGENKDLERYFTVSPADWQSLFQQVIERGWKVEEAK